MNTSEIPEIRVESVGDEVTFHLPPRPLGRLRLAGLLPIGFSAVWFGTLSNTLLPQFRRLANHPQPHDYFIGIFLLGFVLAGCVPAGLGLIMLFGRCRIRWRDGRLMISERVGPFGWPRRMPGGTIRKFMVVGGGVPGAGDRPLPGAFGSVAALLASFESGLPRTVATGYPRPWLEAIARDLSARAGIDQSAVPPPVEVYHAPDAELSAEALEKPAGSPVLMQQGNQGIVLDVPPGGLWKGSQGIFFFAVFWCLIVGMITVGLAREGKFELKSLPVFGVFWLVGLGMLAAAINLGRRRFTFTTGPGQLTVVRSGPFGTKQFEFKRGDITEISVGRSNVEQNHRPVLELQVKLVDGKKAGLLAGRDPEELRWIATMLRRSLDLAAPAQAAPAGLAGWLAGRTVSRQTAGPAGNILGLVIFALVAAGFFWNIYSHTRSRTQHRSQAPPSGANSFLTNLPISTDPTLVFNAFGPSGAYQTSHFWFVGQAAHAEWFVPTLSGNLSEILLALLPNPPQMNPGTATIFLTDDHRGFPGQNLESFAVSASEAKDLIKLESVRQPALQAGVKYWLCARSEGGWHWYFNNQNIVHGAARQTGPDEWASAGDFCYVPAFSIRVSTNQSPPTLAQPASGDNADSSSNH